MNKKYIERLILVGLAIVAAVVVVIVTAIIMMPRERTTKAQNYDFECTTGPVKNPLKECKK
jgi:hypothetical protein